MFKRFKKKSDTNKDVTVSLDIISSSPSSKHLKKRMGDGFNIPNKIRSTQKKRIDNRSDNTISKKHDEKKENVIISKKHDKKKKEKHFFLQGLFIKKLSIKDQTLIAKRLSFLIGSNVPIIDSLHILEEQATSRGMKKILEYVIEDVNNGRFLSAALGKFQGHFGEFAINIIKVGESSGVLGQNLKYLAQELEKKAALKRKIVSALVYPIFVTLATLGVTILLMTYIFPRILPIFSSVGVELPVTTRILIAVSEFFSSYGLLSLGVLLALGIVFVVLYRSIEAFHIFIDKALLKFPISGRIMQHFNMANITRTFGLLLKSGSTIVEAIETTAYTTGNHAYRQELLRAVAHVQRGEKVSGHFMQHKGLFPILVGHMVAIGEKTGNLSGTLVYLSEMYEEEVDTQTKNLSSAVEPVLMLIMGVLVGFVAISVISPIYEITQTISNQI